MMLAHEALALGANALALRWSRHVVLDALDAGVEVGVPRAVHAVEQHAVDPRRALAQIEAAGEQYHPHSVRRTRRRTAQERRIHAERHAGARADGREVAPL